MSSPNLLDMHLALLPPHYPKVSADPFVKAREVSPAARLPRPYAAHISFGVPLTVQHN